MYYFKYKVTYKNYHGKVRVVKIRADNPAHLMTRFKALYPCGKLISFESL